MVHDQFSEKDLPLQDDGWWASVLAEEENRTASMAGKSQKDEEAEKTSLDWEKAARFFHQDEIVEMKVTSHNRGGLLVEGGGLAGFVPCSHLLSLPFQIEDECREEYLAGYADQTLRLKIIECVPEESRLVFSERAARTEAGKRPELFSTIQSGQHLEGEVTNVTEFGVFVDLGGVEGLVHISELSWGTRGASEPNLSSRGTCCRPGDGSGSRTLPNCAQFEKIDAQSLENVLETYPVDSIIQATITALVPYGAFARLEEGLEGLIHASEIPIPPNCGIKDVLSPGKNVRVRVLQVDPSRQRLGLSMRVD